MKQPKTEAEWAQARENHKEGVIIIEKELYNSEAFKELSKKPTHVLVLLAALVQRWFEKKDRRNNKKSRRVLDRPVYLTQNMLKDRGIQSPTTQAEAKKRIVELGFLDVKEQGTYLQASIFGWSNRWKAYPDGNYHAVEETPGKLLYPECTLKNPGHPIHVKRKSNGESKTKSHSKNECRPHSKDECNKKLSHSRNECNESASCDIPHSENECII